MSEWKLVSRYKRSVIKYVLASKFAQPKSFTEIWNVIREDPFSFSKQTLVNYLKGMEKEKEIVTVKVGERKRALYALPNWKECHKLFLKYKNIMKYDVKRASEIVEIAIENIHKLKESEVLDFVFGLMIDLELRQLHGFDILLTLNRNAVLLAPILIKDFISIPYNLRIHLLWKCLENYPKATNEAINLLKKKKMIVLKTREYQNVLSKLGIKPLG